MFDTKKFDAKKITFLMKNVRIPSADERRQMAENFVSTGLKKIGAATQSEVTLLRAKIERLETELTKAKKAAGSKVKSAAETSAVTGA